MKRLSLLVLPILFLLSCGTATQQTTPPAQPTNTPIKVTATDLTRLYEQNVVAADYTYTQKLVTVSGTVVGIERFVDTIHVHLSAALRPYTSENFTVSFRTNNFEEYLASGQAHPLLSQEPVKDDYGGESSLRIAPPQNPPRHHELLDVSPWHQNLDFFQHTD